MRCALVAPGGVDLSVLFRTLGANGVDVVTTSDLGAGAALAQGPVDSVDCAIAVLPTAVPDLAAGMVAVYIEIGILVGRGIPLMVIVEPPALPPQAIGALRTVNASADNATALEFHIKLFVNSVPASTRPLVDPAVGSGSAFYRYQSHLQAVLEAPSKGRAELFETLVEDLLRDCGAVVEPRVGHDNQVDIAAYLPGYEKTLGPFVVEVKSGLLDQHRHAQAQIKLAEYVLNSRIGLGIIVYESLTATVSQSSSTPFVISLGLEELLNKLKDRPLGKVLTDARNRALHGI